MISQTPIATKTRDKVVLPKLLDGLTKFERIVCGSEHCFAITTTNRVLAWGNNSNGRLGISVRRLEESNVPENIFSTYVPFPLPVDALNDKKIDWIATETDHALALSSETGEVYAWGAGAFGKLGFGSLENAREPTILEGFKIASEYGMKVCEVACGENHTLAIVEENSEETKKKRIFVWGCGRNWQLGLSSDVSEDIREPHQIDPDPFDGQALHVFAAHNYSCAISQNGEVFTWGSGEFGRLGYNTETKQQRVPRQIKNLQDSKIVSVSLGAFHAAAITNTGQVYTWGKGLAGQLGHEEVKSEETLKPVTGLLDRKVTQVACGENHTIALISTGEVYTWGAGQLGQLGHGDMLKRNIPTRIEEFKEKKIVQISAGKRHSATLTSEGLVYLWGSNEYCQLGMRSSTTTTVFARKKTDGGPSHTEKPFADLADPKPFISYNNSPKEAQIHLPQKFLEAEIKNYTFSLSQLNTFQSVTPLAQAGTPVKQDQQQQQESSNSNIAEENKFLRERIKALELSSDLALYKHSQQKIYETVNIYARLLDQDFASTPGESLQSIIQKNTRIDLVYKHFKQKIHEFKIDDPNTINFCMQMFERLCDLRRKANYAII